jgi:hypothetical protein
MTGSTTEPTSDGGSWLTGTELVALAATTILAAALTLSYLGDRAGLSVTPVATFAAALVLAALVVIALWRGARRSVLDTTLFLVIVGLVWASLLRLSWPGLLPLGSGSDLAHHLQLIGYIERQGHLAREASAGALLGEMAHYTPGLHLLAVIAGGLAGTDGLHAVYPVVTLAVALKAGILFLILLRLFSDSAFRLPLALAGVLLVFALSAYSLGSFTRESFLAQVVSELFAIVLWWTILAWDWQPTRAAMALFALAGIAAFLTWPIWIGPPILCLVIVVLLNTARPASVRLAHLALALAPIAVVALLHATGRSGWLSMAAASGAVVQPSPAALGVWLAPMALAGLLLTARDRRFRVVVALVVALAVQAAALLLVARASGAANAYMAIKMTYLAIYPAIALAVLAIGTLLNAAAIASQMSGTSRLPHVLAWAVVLGLGVVVLRDRATSPKPLRIVSEDLEQAGRWARDHVPPGCVDYLVANDNTAYWLHLAVLGNPRISERTADDDTFFTQPSMARWLAPNRQPTYAIADLSILPAEIRGDVDFLQQFGSAAVIARRGESSCPR